jgi:hypothetical protein
MARPGLMRHRKFLRLAMLVGGPAAARGHLELLWDAAYECGEASVGDATDVELVAGWTGEPGVLFKALLTCGGDGPGFIEETATPNRYQVHDLFHHAPDYVRKRWLREAARRQQRDKVQTEAGHGPVSDRTTSGHGADNGRTPAPAPKIQDKTKDTCSAAGADAAPEVLTLTPPGKKTATKHAKGGKPNPDVKRLVDAAVTACQEFRKFKPVNCGVAEAQAMAALLRGRTYDEALHLVREFYRDPPEWNLQQGTFDLIHIPRAATKLLARMAGGGNGKRARDATGAVVPQRGDYDEVEDTVEMDEHGVERSVRLYRSPATGEVTRRRWGKPTKAGGGGDGEQRGQVQGK